MVSSLEFGGAPGAGPLGSSSPFLTINPSSVPLGGTHLRSLLESHGGGVEYVEARRAQQVPNNPSLGQFNLQRMGAGRFTAATIRNMHSGVIDAKCDPRWRLLMEDIRRQGREAGMIGWKDYLGELAWFDHYFRNVLPLDYVRDPHQVEFVKHPWWVLATRAGDCDDLSCAMTGALGSLGAPHRFRTYRADPLRPNEESHVSAQLYVPGTGWVNSDLTLVGVPLGFEPQGFRTTDWPEPKY